MKIAIQKEVTLTPVNKTGYPLVTIDTPPVVKVSVECDETRMDYAIELIENISKLFKPEVRE
jgi:hypothetical protein